MAERSFAREVQDLRLGAGEEFRGEGILAVTKALLQSGVGYVGGYQGAPISHLMDVLADAQDILADLGVHFEASASEAAAASMLAASVMYPIRGAVTWKSTAGTNVACDALSNLASGGVTGGALIVIGEDYGEGSSIMQERTHAFAMKSQIWLLDPRPNLPGIVRGGRARVRAVGGVEHAGDAGTAHPRLPRPRPLHLQGQPAVRPSRSPARSNEPRRDTQRIVLPPASYRARAGEGDEALARRAWSSSARTRLNETFAGDIEDIGIILQGGMYNGVMRALALFGLADVWGDTRIPLHVLNVTYPLVDDDLAAFCRGKRAVLVVEEGQPDFIEQALHAILRRADVPTQLAGKDVLPMGGEYTAAGAGRRPAPLPGGARAGAAAPVAHAAECRRGAGRRAGEGAGAVGAAAPAELLHRLPGAADLLRADAGAEGTRRASRRRRYRLPPVLDQSAVQPSAPRRWATASAHPRRRRSR